MKITVTFFELFHALKKISNVKGAGEVGRKERALIQETTGLSNTAKNDDCNKLNDPASGHFHSA